METRENQIVRMRPRPNENVNAFFMCDWGRLNYRCFVLRKLAPVPAPNDPMPHADTAMPALA